MLDTSDRIFIKALDDNDIIEFCLLIAFVFYVGAFWVKNNLSYTLESLFPCPHPLLPWDRTTHAAVAVLKIAAHNMMELLS